VSEIGLRIRVVIVEDHPMLADGTASFLRATEDIEVTGIAYDGASGIAMIRAEWPDVVLLDLRLPDMHGIDVARQIRSQLPGIGIVVMTGYDYGSYRRELNRMGIGAVLGKTATGDQITSAVRSAAAALAGPVPTSDVSTFQDVLGALTDREAQVLEMMAGGRRNWEIAQALNIAVKTVEFHITNLLPKLGARSRMDAVLKAQDLGLMNPHMLPPEIVDK
jgi:DNA-binding NarL/FixJ family response regulator